MERLKQLRKDKNLTQEEIAKLINISTPTYNRYENGKSELMISDVERLAKVFDVSPSYIAGWSDDYEKTPRSIKNIDLNHIENWKARFFKDFDYKASNYSTIIKNVYVHIPFGIPLNSIENKYISRFLPQISISGYMDEENSEIFVMEHSKPNLHPVISEGTILVCKTNMHISNNDFVIVHIDGNAAEAKQYKIIGGRQYLTELTPDNIPIELSETEDIQIVGVVLQAINYLNPIRII